MATFDGHLFFLKSGLFMVIALFLTVKSEEGGCDRTIENTLRTLLTPQQFPSIQLQALRRSMLRKFQDALLKAQENDKKAIDEKKSLSSLAQWDNLPDKRNLEALARAGYVRTLPSTTDDEGIDENDPNFKRSIANLAKNGQLPTSYNINESKRGIESLARNGELYHRNNKQMQELLDDLYTNDYDYDGNKRNIGSLAKNFDFPLYGNSGKRFVGSLARGGDLFRYGPKRNVAALARDGGVRTSGKRNVAALLRQDSYLNGEHGNGGHTERPEVSNEGKRNIGSIKAQYPGRSRRQADFYRDIDDDGEYASPIYQNNQEPDEYEQLLRALGYPLPEKRFLGSVAKTGWFRPSTSSRFSRYYHRQEKRHIGALARLGWLPTLRSIRRFNRSGRSTELDCREASADGEAEDDSFAEDSLPLDDSKRFLLQPAVDNILLRKILIQPKTHHPLVTGYSS